MKRFSLFIPLFLLLLISYENVNAQFKTEPSNFPSPSAFQSLNQEGVQPNLFTGALNIDVPIYQVTEGNIVLPISASYSSAQVKPSLHPGILGIGWNLNAGGSISRVRNYVSDEHRMPGTGTYDGPKMGFYDNYSKLDVNNWSTASKLKEYENGRTHGVLFEVTADEFNFNFLGYSGKFYMNEKGKWVVISDADIKVEFNPEDGFINNEQLLERIGGNANTHNQDFINRYFDKFTLITPDGIRCEFGGLNATEYSTPYRMQFDYDVTPTSWFMTKISSRGKTVELNYERDSLVCSLSQNYSYHRMTRTGGDFFGIKALSLDPSCGSESGSFSTNPGAGFLIFPVYLTSIRTSNVQIDFERSLSTELRYLDFDLNHLPGYDKFTFQYFYVYINDKNSLQWQKLDRIKIKYSNSNLLKQFDFNYTNSLATRLKLLSIQERDKNGIARPAIKFSYFPSTFSNYCSDNVDHWGYNTVVRTIHRSTVAGFMNTYTNAREPDTIGVALRSEVMSRIDFSDGGYTELEYEPNTYTKVVDLERTSLTSFYKNQYAGGVRVKKISSFPEIGAAPLVKEFFYVSNYTGQLDRSALLSSGILGGKVQYYWPGFKGKDTHGTSYTYDFFSSGTLLPYGHNALGSHIGYSEVIESTPNNGFVKRTFTNFDTKEGILYPYMDEPAINWIDENRSVFSPCTSNADKRGKVARIEIFNKNNQKVKESSYTYARFSNDYLRGVHLETLPLCNENTAAIFGTAYKIYIHPPLLTSESEKVYASNDPGNEEKTIVTSKTYEYNAYRLLKKSVLDKGDGKPVITINKYVFDYDMPSNIPFKEMKEKHIINPAIEQLTFEQHNSERAAILSGTLSIFGNSYLPDSTYLLYGQPESQIMPYLNNPGPFNNFITSLPYIKKSAMSYDSYGNLVEIKDKNHPPVTFIYSYNSSKPVAKILNATKEQVSTALGFSSYSVLASSFSSSLTETLQSKLSSLRNLLPKARVTTYTHDPLVGITSTTDENGKTTFCTYDNFNRVQMIKDDKGNILNAYRYNNKVK